MLKRVRIKMPDPAWFERRPESPLCARCGQPISHKQRWYARHKPDTEWQARFFQEDLDYTHVQCPVDEA